MMGLNLGAGLFTWHLCLCLFIPGGRTVDQSDKLQNCVLHRLVPANRVAIIEKNLFIWSEQMLLQ